MTRKQFSITSQTVTLILCTSSLIAAEMGIPWKEDTEDSTLISLGLVGVRVKTDQLLFGLPESHSSTGVVRYIFRNSPAEGKLQLEDEVVGVNGKPFDKDFSRRMGAAIS